MRFLSNLLGLRWRLGRACVVGLAAAILLGVLPAVAAESNPLAGVGGKLVYVDAGGSLVVVEGTTGKKRILVRGNPNRTIWKPVWSPDGSFIAFLAYPLTNHVPREDDVYVIAADGSSAARRVTDHANFMQSVAWLPDSQVLVYATD